MPLRLIIPVKPFDEAKQRLAPALNAEQRASLAHHLFRHVLATAVHFAGPGAVIVISRAPDVLALAKAAGVCALAETSRPDLNAALAQAATFAHRIDDTKVLIVASDLPLLSQPDLAAMAAADCAIAPDRRQRGTNALLWPACSRLAFYFGENSFERHRAIAQAASFDPQIVVRPGLAHDIDLPSDLLEGFPPAR